MRALAAYEEVLARQSELKQQIETLSKERKEILDRMQGYEQLKKENVYENIQPHKRKL